MDVNAQDNIYGNATKRAEVSIKRGGLNTTYVPKGVTQAACPVAYEKLSHSGLLTA
jgi:hypothetical protein